MEVCIRQSTYLSMRSNDSFSFKFVIPVRFNGGHAVANGRSLELFWSYLTTLKRFDVGHKVHRGRKLQLSTTTLHCLTKTLKYMATSILSFK